MEGRPGRRVRLAAAGRGGAPAGSETWWWVVIHTFGGDRRTVQLVDGRADGLYNAARLNGLDGEETDLDEFLDEIAGAIRGRVAGGRTHGEVAVELHLDRSVVSRIVRGERTIGLKSLDRIMKADPPWLQEVLAGNPALKRGRNGKGQKGQNSKT